MIKFLPKALLCAVLCFFAFRGMAQNDTTKKSGIKVGLSFLNNDVYMGRADSISTPTLIPALGYTFKSGLFFNAELYYITNRKQNKLDGGSIEGGYNYTSDSFEWGASFTKLFYNSNSTQVSSAISSIINAYADYDIAGIITPAVSFNYNIPKSGYKSDFIINPSLSHDFEVNGLFDNNDKLTISPMAAMNAGTQNFYSGYISRRTTKLKKVNTLINTQLTEYDNYLDQFNVLDYEFSVPVEYKSGIFSVNFTPTYSLPKNGLPAPQTAVQRALITGLELKPSIFYFQLGVSLKF
jgi:hypothetical protein